MEAKWDQILIEVEIEYRGKCHRKFREIEDVLCMIWENSCLTLFRQKFDQEWNMQ